MPRPVQMELFGQKQKKIISTENIRDTITGLGHDSLGNIYFWNRKGTPVNANSVKFNGYNIIVYYSGTDTETNIINMIN